MKKLMTACAACVLAGMVSAQVESVNIVGYNTVNLIAEYTLFALNFENVGGGAMPINDAFPYQAGAMKAGGLNDSDQLQVRDGAGYIVYRLRSTSVPANSWCRSGTTPTTDTIATGTAAWYLSRRNPSVSEPLSFQVAGEVANDATKNLTIVSGYNLIANPYPYSVGLNSGIGFQSGMVSGGLNDSDQLQVRDGTGYIVYRLRATSSPANSWCRTGTTPTTDELPIGTAAWYLSRQASGSFQLQIARPW